MKELNILVSTSTFGADDRSPLIELERFRIRFQLNPYQRKLTVAETIELLKDKDGIIAGTEILNEEVFAECPNLKVISRCGAGMDAVDTEAAKQRQIAVYNTPHVHVDAVTELTLAGIFELHRRLHQMHTSIQEGNWKRTMGRNISGKTLAILGLGKIGKRVSEVMQCCGVKVIAFDKFPNHEFAEKHNIQFKTLPEIWSSADIISLHLSYSAAVKYIINQSVFDQLKSNVLIINTARGGLIDENALAKFLQANPNAGAYLDTFEEEPYKGTLRELPNILLTPHIGTFTKETRVNMEMEAVRNLVNHFN